MGLFVLAWVSALGQATPPAELSYYEGQFIVRSGGKIYREPVSVPTEKGPLSIAFRRDNHWAVWDDRGLTVRVGTLVRSSRLAEIAVSPRIFSRDEILATLSAKRDKNARYLSGARRIGTKAYFVPRWVGPDGKPWLEALVEVDLTVANPKPRLLAKLPGLSPATLNLDSLLITTGGKLAIPIQREKDWGLAVFQPETSSWDVRPMGDRLVKLSDDGVLVEKTPAGTYAMSRIVLPNNQRQPIFESRKPLQVVAGTDPLLVAEMGQPLRVFDTSSGRIVDLGTHAFVRKVGPFLIAFDGKDVPTKATMYSMSTWSSVGTWKAN